ncbi:hypothetical protein niasHT_021743 [Heterodera trifolii]|uniref:Uncharacterized protein n=1 Tax=Heterodera trifolii TaxID=157864 RepID=A0ABD2KSS1_9BILA
MGGRELLLRWKCTFKTTTHRFFFFPRRLLSFSPPLFNSPRGGGGGGRRPKDHTILQQQNSSDQNITIHSFIRPFHHTFPPPFRSTKCERDGDGRKEFVGGRKTPTTSKTTFIPFPDGG